MKSTELGLAVVFLTLIGCTMMLPLEELNENPDSKANKMEVDENSGTKKEFSN